MPQTPTVNSLDAELRKSAPNAKPETVAAMSSTLKAETAKLRKMAKKITKTAKTAPKSLTTATITGEMRKTVQAVRKILVKLYQFNYDRRWHYIAWKLVLPNELFNFTMALNLYVQAVALAVSIAGKTAVSRALFVSVIVILRLLRKISHVAVVIPPLAIRAARVIK